ncbi:MAG TPA: flagellar basal-body MS-ring/collar protein FliF [Acidimicrobiia bacterium]|nr:flagellar basal-body MS-ring/collar protein FliF [Acidimicrobiia bacterium]
MAVDVTVARRRAATVWSGFTSGQKTMLGLAIAAVIVGGYAFTQWAAQPTWTPLYGNLSATDAGSVTQELAGKGVRYKLSDGGATVLVPQTEVYQLRLDMSAKGLPTGGSQGYALLDKQGITTSEFRQRVDYQRALEGELARTIGAIDGVAGADVHLVIPADDVFADDSRQPSASVLLRPTTQGKKFGSDQVRAIVNLVAGSVEGLSPEAVTVADSGGHVLSAPGEGGLDASGDAQAAQARTFEDGLARSLEEMLAPVTGAGGAVVRVKAALDFDERSTTTERFDQPSAGQTSPVVNESTSNETFAGPGASTAAGGVLGTTGQAPAAGAASNANNYQKQQSDRSFAVGKVTQQVKSAPGKVSRLSVAVLVDDKVKVAPAEITNLVNAAAGIDGQRGDVVSVQAMAFDRSATEAAAKEQKAAAAAKSKTQMLNLVRTGGVLLIVLVALFLAWRSAKKAGVTRYPVPGMLPAGPVQVDALHAALSALSAGAPTAAPVEPAERFERAALPASGPDVNDELAELIERQPEEVASILRGWLADRRG